MITTDKTKKIISSLFIVLILLPTVLFSIPKQAVATNDGGGGSGDEGGQQVPEKDVKQETAGWLSQFLHAIGVPSTVEDTLLHVKDYANWLATQLLKMAAKMVLARMTQATINWINSDFHGAPLFIQNPESFFKNIAKSEVKSLVDMIGYDTLRFPFGPQTALNVIASYKSTLETNAQYTLSKVINDPALLIKYRTDFNVGGWNGFLVNTQYPQNNYLGFTGIIQDNLAVKIDGTVIPPAQKIQNLLQQGMGFLSPQTCTGPNADTYNNGLNEFQKPSFKSKIKYDPPEVDKSAGESPELVDYDNQYNASVAAEKTDWAKTNTCTLPNGTSGLVNTTPGSVAANHIMSAINSPFLTTALDGAIGNSLAAVFDALLTHFMSKGLNALATTVNPSSGDNWSYNGNTLDNNNVATDFPTGVLVAVNETTTKPIPIGTGGYSIITQPNANIATAEISVSGSSGNKLIVKGISIGSTFFEVKDSSTNPPIRVDINVNKIGDFAITPCQVIPPSAPGVTPVVKANTCQVSTDKSNPLTINISGGTAPYSRGAGTDEGIAIAQFSDTNIVIIGVNTGTTSFVVKDSAAHTITVQVIIGGPTDLTLPAHTSAGIGETVDTPITGGVVPYTIYTLTNSGIVDVAIDNDTKTLTITGKGVGEASVIIQDSSNPPKAASSIIDIGITPTFKVDKKLISVTAGHSANVILSGGIAPYSIQTQPNKPNTSIATTTPASGAIPVATVTISGVAVGPTSVILQDSAVPPNTLVVNITVTVPLGTCIVRGYKIPGGPFTQSACLSGAYKMYGPVWTQTN